jgi:hypothetical protein
MHSTDLLRRVGYAFAPLLLLTSCATSSHVLIGTVHPPISPDDVAVYTQAPEFFEEVAQIKASSGASLLSVEEKADLAIEALTREAARLGANAIVLEEDEDDGTADTIAYSRTTATKSDGGPPDYGRESTVGIDSSTGVLNKTVRGLAIYVPK